MIRALLVAACLALVAAAPAAGRSRTFAYVVTSASMHEQVDFRGGGPACAHAGVCGVAGSVSYGFDGAEGGFALLDLARRGRRSAAFGVASIADNGLTTATVSGPGGPPCGARIIRRGDRVDIGGTAGRVRLSFHAPPFFSDFLDNYCPGPTDSDLWHAHALPRVSLPARQLRRERVRIDVSSQRAFSTGPFTGSASFSASIRMRRVALL